MKKLFIILIYFMITLSVNSYAEVITKIEAKGNQRITVESIAVFGDIQLGKDYNSSDINLLIKKLYETNFFSNISIKLESGILLLTVEENPIINTIVWEGEPADKYIEALTPNLSLREKSSFLSNFVKSDLNIIKDFYSSLGFYFIEIDASIEKLDKNRVNLIYTLNKGKKAKISKIYFLGDKKIREKRLRDVITSQEAKFWKVLSRNVYLNKGRVELDKRLLKNYYKNKGYYEVDISASNVDYSEGEGFVLTYTINAGQRYKFKKIFAEVSQSLDQSAFVSLENEFNKVIGEYYSRTKLTNILKKIDELSESKELQFVNHKLVETLEGDGVEVKIEIFEGKKFSIERINIVGNNVTNDSVIRGEMVVDEGDPFSELLVSKSINNIKARGIFGEVDYKITEGSSPDLKVLEVSIQERATGEISAGAGVGTDGSSILFGISENNWLGKGIRLNTALNISDSSISGNFSLNNPNYNYTGNSVFTAIDISSADNSDTSGFESTKTGLSLGTAFEQYEDVYISTQLVGSIEDIEITSNTATASIKKMAGQFENIDLNYSLTKDKRDQRFQPTSGYWAKFSQTLPILVDSSAIINGVDVSTYHAFSEDVLGSIKLWGRSIHGFNSEDVRLTKRLYLPPDRLRGFQNKRTGPKDGKDYIGGNYATALSFETQLPNLLPEYTKTDISVFIDTANLWGVDYSSSLEDSNKIRSSIGMAANVYTIIGPLSFTLAQNLTKASQDETEKFNFRIGTSF